MLALILVRGSRRHMSKVLRFRRSKRQSLLLYGRRSITSKRSSRKSRPSTKRDPVVAAANVFQILAIENPYGLRMLESLARRILAATQLAVRHD